MLEDDCKSSIEKFLNKKLLAYRTIEDMNKHISDIYFYKNDETQSITLNATFVDSKKNLKIYTFGKNAQRHLTDDEVQQHSKEIFEFYSCFKILKLYESIDRTKNTMIDFINKENIFIS
jgi:peptide deformylase